MSVDIDCVVVGAGVVGLAVAREMALAGREVLVIAAGEAIGIGTSSRNSEVIHAVFTPPPGSLKAQLCVEVRHALYAYCETHGVSTRRTGKLIVVKDQAQIRQLEVLLERGLRMVWMTCACSIVSRRSHWNPRLNVSQPCIRLLPAS